MITKIIILMVAMAFGDDGDFSKHKAEMLGHIEEKIQKMQEHKTCISGASDKDALKKCHESMRDWHKSERREHREKRKERMGKRMDKMNQKMQKMDDQKPE